MSSAHNAKAYYASRFVIRMPETERFEMRALNALFAQIREQDSVRIDHCDIDSFTFFFLSENPLIVDNIFPQLEDILTSQDFGPEFLDKFTKKARLERERLAAQIRDYELLNVDPRFYTRQLPLEDRKISIDSMGSYLDFLNETLGDHEGIIDILLSIYRRINGDTHDHNYVRENYHLYHMGSFLYDEFIAMESLFHRFNNVTALELASLYRDHGIDLSLVDRQFDKYNLLSLNDNININNHHDSQTLVDDRIDRYLWIDVPRELLSALEKMIKSGLIKDISFNITRITDFVIALEELEIGSVFSFEVLNLPAISKLYDKNEFENSLWIKVGKDQSITFEELCTEFPTSNGKKITQAVHIEFSVENGVYFINHLDHEYFMYTDGEYDRRRCESEARGFAKCKSFKIDNARIPLDFSVNGRYFLFIVLDAYFKNKKLLLEYFETVQLP